MHMFHVSGAKHTAADAISRLGYLKEHYENTVCSDSPHLPARTAIPVNWAISINSFSITENSNDFSFIWNKPINFSDSDVSYFHV